jgi:hypothetical protein
MILHQFGDGFRVVVDKFGFVVDTELLQLGSAANTHKE